MRSLGALFLTILMIGVGLAGSAEAGSAGQGGEEPGARVITDGRLRPGHLETIRLAGFPGRGSTELSFFPTAICEDGCGARSFRGARTNANGAAKFRVRVPGTFFDSKNRHEYFRDGERIAVNLLWEGPGDSFVPVSAEPEPILVRTHGSERG